MAPRLNVATVKYGSAYPADYVNRMLSMLTRHLAEPFDLYCITEDSTGLDPEIKVIAPPFDVPGWWNKIFLFSPVMPQGETLYLDIDQIITGDLTPLLETCRKSRARLCAYRDPLRWMGSQVNSSWLYYRAPELSFIYDAFRRDLPGVFELEGGDQLYIWQQMKDIYFIDEAVPGAVKSFRFEVCVVEGETLQVPSDIDAHVRIVNFHGRPKPHELSQVGWVQQHWR